MNLNFSLFEMLTTPFFKVGQSSISISSILTAGLIVLAAFLISAVLQKILNEKISARMGIVPGVTYAIKRVLHYLVVSLGCVIAFQLIGLSLTSLAVVLGFLSVGIGFGLQNITTNFISGLIILFERPISVGDFVTVGDQSGTVMGIQMRATVIRTRDNIAVIVPNSEFISKSVTNWSHGDTTVRLHAPIGVAYGSDESQVAEALLEVGRLHSDVLSDPPPEVRFLGFGDSSLNFELLVWTHKPERQFLIHSQLNFMIYRKFRDVGIKIPFPQQDVHLQMSPAIERLGQLPKSSSPVPPK